jgi:hypothetical protein
MAQMNPTPDLLFARIAECVRGRHYTGSFEGWVNTWDKFYKSGDYHKVRLALRSGKLVVIRRYPNNPDKPYWLWIYEENKTL